MYLPGFYDIFNERWGQFQTAHVISDLHFNEDDLKIYASLVNVTSL